MGTVVTAFFSRLFINIKYFSQALDKMIDKKSLLNRRGQIRKIRIRKNRKKEKERIRVISSHFYRLFILPSFTGTYTLYLIFQFLKRGAVYKIL